MSGEPPHSASDDLRRVLAPIVTSLRNQYVWELISEADLLELAIAEASSAEAQERLSSAAYGRRALEYLVRGICARILHAACIQSTDTERRERGYNMLRRCLYRVAFNLRREQAEDITQEAVLKIIGTIERCRKPEAFLTFALLKLRDVKLPLDTLPLPPFIPAPETDIIGIMARQHCDELLRRAVGKLKQRQQLVLLKKYDENQRDEQIARQIGETVENIRVLRHRALKKLRADPSLRPCLEDEADDQVKSREHNL